MVTRNGQQIRGSPNHPHCCTTASVIDFEGNVEIIRYCSNSYLSYQLELHYQKDTKITWKAEVRMCGTWKCNGWFSNDGQTYKTSHHQQSTLPRTHLMHYAAQIQHTERPLVHTFKVSMVKLWPSVWVPPLSPKPAASLPGRAKNASLCSNAKTFPPAPNRTIFRGSPSTINE